MTPAAEHTAHGICEQDGARRSSNGSMMRGLWIGTAYKVFGVSLSADRIRRYIIARRGLHATTMRTPCTGTNATGGGGPVVRASVGCRSCRAQIHRPVACITRTCKRSVERAPGPAPFHAAMGTRLDSTSTWLAWFCLHVTRHAASSSNALVVLYRCLHGSSHLGFSVHPPRTGTARESILMVERRGESLAWKQADGAWLPCSEPRLAGWLALYLLPKCLGLHDKLLPHAVMARPPGSLT